MRHRREFLPKRSRTPYPKTPLIIQADLPVAGAACHIHGVRSFGSRQGCCCQRIDQHLHLGTRSPVGNYQPSVALLLSSYLDDQRRAQRVFEAPEPPLVHAGGELVPVSRDSWSARDPGRTPLSMLRPVRSLLFGLTPSTCSAPCFQRLGMPFAYPLMVKERASLHSLLWRFAAGGCLQELGLVLSIQ